MLNLARKLLGRDGSSPGRTFSSSRPLVLLQSDDWGRVGVRDREGYELLRASGIPLGERPYDLYSLETADDVIALRDLLAHHRDSTGRSPCVVMNFVTANLDFAKMAASENPGDEIFLLPLTAGLPGKWNRPKLFESYREGIADGVFYPALHGSTHFCRQSVEEKLAAKGEQAALLQTLWNAETPYIYWRMPWVGYEYSIPGAKRDQFLPAKTQAALIRESADVFSAMFSRPPLSACAPGYRANADTRAAWAKCGVRVAQNGVSATALPYLDESGMLHLYRTMDFEPALQALPVEDYLHAAEANFSRGQPVVISVHSINFHSSLKDFRGTSLKALDILLSGLEAKHPDLLYVHDGDLYELVTKGRFEGDQGAVSVTFKDSGRSRASVGVAR